MIEEFNMLISGVGGQGSVLMGELLGRAAVADGLNVKGSEIIGLAQRGGAVTSVLRIGSACQSPMVPLGTGDIMIGLEPAEALRNITYMAKSSIIVVNDRRVMSVTTLLGMGTYASIEEIIEKLKKYSSRVISMDAIALAKQAGSARSANIVMMGAGFGTGKIPVRIETIKATIEARFGARESISNIKAFELGYNLCR
ncbi:indolepyruvate oxidoreductase subunit beta [Chloroflexota bacterium]